MKKNFFYAGMMAMTIIATAASCSKNDDISAGNNENLIATGEQIITLDLQDTDVLASRSRPLHSTENQGAEEVTDVKLFVFEHQNSADNSYTSDMKIVNVLTIQRWNQNSTSYNYGQKHTLKLEGDNKLKKGKKYTILAVGQNESEDNNYSDPYQIIAGGLAASSIKDGTNWTVSEEEESDLKDKTWNAGSERGKGFLLTKAKDADATSGITQEAEIFSGISVPVNLDIESDGGFTVNVLMKRQVAGVLGYFSKVPAIVSNDKKESNWYKNYDAVKKIRLIAHNKNTQIDLTYSLGTQKDDATNTGDEFVINGFTQSETKNAKFSTTTTSDKDAYIVYEIDLSKWFDVNEACSEADDASYWYGTSASSSAQYLYFEDNGLPTLGDDAKYAESDQSTQQPQEFGLTLESPDWKNPYDINNNNPAVETNTVLAGEFVIPFEKIEDTGKNTFELQLIGEESGNDKILKSWNVKLDEASIDENRGDNTYIFNVYRNHLYQIGTRTTDDPDNPGSTGDNPQALDKDQDLVIKINDQWEFIHNMGLE